MTRRIPLEYPIPQLIFSASKSGAQTAPCANPAQQEFLYFIQRPARMCSDDPKQRMQRFFNFRNDVLPMRSRPAYLPARLPA
ncbi:hypothetical protein [Burkholderia lata]|uniref:hypothetical protein n=1 Tax=Burkholderia lata (strain ATCC 17760 / DSM 23089 / LMG 22485 / NCIMB 9086 / R18194 / 383) TaxID=482957 RepID=UPI0015829819|nr:hypothetical protein [Burkholderia lata]